MRRSKSLLSARFTLCLYLTLFLFSLDVEVAFQSEEGNVLQGEKLLQQKNHSNPLPSPPPSLVTVWGIQSKAWPVTCSLRNKQPAESPKTEAIRGGRLVCEPNRDTSPKASIIEKNSELSQWRVTSMVVHWYIDAVSSLDSAVKVLRLKLSCYLSHVSPGRRGAAEQSR